MQLTHKLAHVLAVLGLIASFLIVPSDPSRQSSLSSDQQDPPPTPDEEMVGGFDIHEEWLFGSFGNYIGTYNMVVFDIDNDGHLEIVTTASNYFSYWYVVRYTGPDTYEQVWMSDPYVITYPKHLEVADIDGDSIGEIIIGESNGRMTIFKGSNMAKIATFSIMPDLVTFSVGDVDLDGVAELVATNGTVIRILSLETHQLEWSNTTYGSNRLILGNVDTDPALEIISPKGAVIDGVTQQVEWVFPGSSGNSNFIDQGDLDGDGIAEVVMYHSDTYTVTAYDVDQKIIKWEISPIYSPSALHIGDVEGDGTLEVLMSYGQGGVIHCYNGQTQVEKWSLSATDGAIRISEGDVDEDGSIELIWSGGKLVVADSATRQTEWQNLYLPYPFYDSAVGDVDDDGEMEILLALDTSPSGSLYIINGKTHEVEWQSVDLGAIDTYDGLPAILIGDMDDDGDTEYVLSGSALRTAIFQVYDGKTHILEHESQGNYPSVGFLSAVAGDVDGDTQTEIVVGAAALNSGATGCFMAVFNGSTGVEEWKSASSWNICAGDVKLADVDSDTHIEILTASLRGINVFDGTSHQQKWYANVEADCLIVSDLDNDGTKDILVGMNNGLLYAYDGKTHRLKQRIPISSHPITGLVEADVNNDGTMEYIVTDQTQIFIIRKLRNTVIWKSPDKGDYVLAQGNRLNVADIDADSNQEIVAGSFYALYQYESVSGVAGYELFLPVVTNVAFGLFGRVTFQSSAAAGVNLELYSVEGNQFTYVMSTTTASDGRYSFGQRNLVPGKAYVVYYFNPSTGYNQRLYVWITRTVTFSPDTYENIGDFDIADLMPQSPYPGSAVIPPVNFQWTKRSASPTDSYQFDLFDPDGTADFYTPKLGFVDNYQLTSRPAGFGTGHMYGWTAWINSPDGGFGIPYYYSPVAFSAYGANPFKIAITGLQKNNLIPGMLIRPAEKP